MAKKFDFVSPGVQLNEIDQSQLPAETQEDGILLIGTALKGPAMKPIKVKDLDSFIEVFGAPQSGKPANDTDIWRDGNRYGPTYAAYAAQAHLAAGVSPVTFIRLLGENDPLSTNSDVQAGWNLGGGAASTSATGNTLAYGLFIMPSASAAAGATGSLAAIIYTTASAATLRGTPAGGSGTTSSIAQLIESQATGQPSTFKLDIWSSNSAYDTYTFHFDPTKKDGFIRNILNTNPQKIDSTNFATTESYFLGQSYEESVREYVNDISSSAGKQYGILLPLVSGSAHWLDNKKEAAAAKSGWIISRDANPVGNTGYYAPSATKLFRVVALHEGEWIQENYGIKISDLTLGTTTVPDSHFSLSVVDKAGNEVEKFSNLNLNEASENFILKKIGDEDRTWDATNKIFNITGDYANRSNYIRIEMSDAWKSGLVDNYALPFGFHGPSKIKDFSLAYGSSGVQSSGDVVNSGTAASAVLTFGSGIPSDGTLTIDFGIEGEYVITFDSAAGSTDASVGSDKAVTIDPSVEIDSAGNAQRVLLLLRDGVTGNKLSNKYTFAYDGSSVGAETVTITAKDLGPAHNITITESLSNVSSTTSAGTDTDNYAHAWVKGNAYSFGTAGDSGLFASLPTDMSCSFLFPDLRLTEQNSKMGGNYNNTDVMGVRHVYGTMATSNKAFYHSADHVEFSQLGGGLDVHSTTNSTETSFIFTLDEVRKESSTGLWYWQSGSLAAGNSYTYTYGTAQYLKDGPRQFNVPLFGGFDGLDVTVVSPFSSENVLSGQTNKGHYAHYSVDKAIEIAADPESVKFDVVSIPGMTNSGLQNKLIRKVEERGDALVVIDIDDDFKDTFENSGTRTGGEVSTAISSIQGRELNSSYAAAYFPRVKLHDTLSGKNEIIVAPASVAAIGAMAYSEANSDGPWFAPAGFNRGGLSVLGGNTGPRVVGAYKTLSKKNRDDLYAENINPIARFPAVGETVIFGQKTLQQVPSALDRINVRRLMIFIKKKIGVIADTLLFDQNVQSTWNRFLAQADPLLASVQSRLGISEYKLVLDTSTTTEDLVDRNIMYAKVFVKPARAIEFIVIDFVVTRTGVEF